MVKNVATVSRLRRTRLVTIGAVAIVASATLSGCGGDSGGSDSKPINPGSLFSGTYEVVVTPKIEKGKPTDAKKSAELQTINRWTVQSTCDGPGDACIAVARSKAPSTNSLNLERMEFVFENGTWTRVVVPPARDCTAAATNKKVDEPWAAIASSTFKADGATTTGPATSFSGEYTYLQNGTCSTLNGGEITIRRVGDLPDDTKPLPKMKVPAIVANPPGSSLHGTYDYVLAPISANPPSYINVFPPKKLRFVFRPICLRDGTTCSVSESTPAGVGQSVLTYVNGRYENYGIGPEQNCTNGLKTYRKNDFHLDVPDGSAVPAAAADGRAVQTYLGGCPGTVTLSVKLTRVGD